MKADAIIKNIMKCCGYNPTTLAAKLGKSTSSAVANPLTRKNNMRLNTFLTMISAMDCEVVVRSRNDNRTEWKLTDEDEDNEKHCEEETETETATNQWRFKV